jgi:DnaJ-domain-containing protein 1
MTGAKNNMGRGIIKEIARGATAKVRGATGNGSNVGLLFVALAGLGVGFLVAVVYAPSLILLVGLIYYEYWTIRKSPQYLSFTKEEADELSIIEEKLKLIGLGLSEISEKGAHLKRNVDGTFHRGSKLGFVLNEKIEKFVDLEEQLQARAVQLRQALRERLDTWKRIASLRFAFRLTTAVYALFIVLAYILNLSANSSSTRISLGNFIVQHLVLGDPNRGLYGRTLLSALACAVIFSLGYKVRRIWLEGVEQFSSPESPDKDGNYEFDIVETLNRWNEHRTDEKGLSKGELFTGSWYEILGVSSQASADEINAAWRVKMRRNHPDRVAGLDPEFRMLAEERSKRLNQAREEGLRRFEA